MRPAGGCVSPRDYLYSFFGRLWGQGPIDQAAFIFISIWVSDYRAPAIGTNLNVRNGLGLHILKKDSTSL